MTMIRRLVYASALLGFFADSSADLLAQGIPPQTYGIPRSTIAPSPTQPPAPRQFGPVCNGGGGASRFGGGFTPFRGGYYDLPYQRYQQYYWSGPFGFFPYNPYWSAPYASSFGPPFQFEGFVTHQFDPHTHTSVTSPPWPDAFQDNAPRPVVRQVKPQFRRSNPQQIEQSVTWMNQADQIVREGHFPQALDAYRRSIEIAEDQAPARFKMAILLAESRRYREAVHQLRSGLALDPTWPFTGQSLSEFFGPDKEQVIHNMLQASAQWARGDIRDPERLFLVGTLIYFSGDHAQAEVPLNSAARLAPGDTQILAFINALQNPPDSTIRQTGNQLPPVQKDIEFPKPESPLLEDEPFGGTKVQPIPKRKLESTPSPSTTPSSEPTVRESTSQPLPSVPESTPAPVEGGPAFPG